MYLDAAEVAIEISRICREAERAVAFKLAARQLGEAFEALDRPAEEQPAKAA
jgi:hypothetical protein